MRLDLRLKLLSLFNDMGLHVGKSPGTVQVRCSRSMRWFVLHRREVRLRTPKPVVNEVFARYKKDMRLCTFQPVVS